jgi:hypothetical protein
MPAQNENVIADTPLWRPVLIIVAPGVSFLFALYIRTLVQWRFMLTDRRSSSSRSRSSDPRFRCSSKIGGYDDLGVVEESAFRVIGFNQS